MAKKIVREKLRVSLLAMLVGHGMSSAIAQDKVPATAPRPAGNVAPPAPPVVEPPPAPPVVEPPPAPPQPVPAREPERADA
ncbi:MAG: hypothetical protein WCO71_10545, partial [Pseudomonadota bacterium]